MAEINLVVGPVGSGKSTFAIKLASSNKAIRFSLDDWFSRLFSPDKPEGKLLKWYPERANRCVDLCCHSGNRTFRHLFDIV